MSTNIKKLIKLNELVSLSFRRKHTVILNPEEEYENKENLTTNFEYDAVKWEIDNEKIMDFINQLSQNNELSDEDKILSIYEKLCQNYVYDDNLISYIQKYDDDSFGVPDGYGKVIDQEWKKNREQHNRRVCYELSRNLAKSIMELFGDNNKFDVCIFYDKGLTHYFTGVTSDEYSIILDLDDFSNIKDLTRIKTGLTAQGIKILEDKDNKFKDALDNFNKNRNRDALRQLEDEINTNNAISTSSMESNSSEQLTESDNIVFLRNAIEILSDKYNIDSQGLFEYMKEIVDIKLGPESRKKVWKKLNENANKSSARCIRCLVIDIDNKKYIIDVDKKLLRIFDEEELKKEDTDFISNEELTPRNWKIDRYRGE